jgi:hypothetical protein
MVYRIERVEEIRKFGFGGTSILHLVRGCPVCVTCARDAFNDGETVTAGAFDEGDPEQCDCGNVIESTYGPV